MGSVPLGPLQAARILIVDDEPSNVLLLQALLGRAGFENVTGTTDPYQALPLVQQEQPDLILLDLRMPGLDGLAIMAQLAPHTGGPIPVPILVLTADVTREAKERALLAGAKDFMTKPPDPVEAVLRIKNLLESRYLQRQLHEHNVRLGQEVQARTHDLEAAYRELAATQLEVLDRLAVAAEYRDDGTGEHARRVGRRAARTAAALGLPPALVELIGQAARLHDLGKIAVPDRILHLPARLSPEQFAIIRQHTTIGAQIVAGSRSRLLQIAEEIALSHHERWDGTGYPHGLAGEAIPISARIVAVIDVFDALTHDRPYKRAWPLADAVAEIRRQRARQFDPRVVDAFLRTLEEEGQFQAA